MRPAGGPVAALDENRVDFLHANCTESGRDKLASLATRAGGPRFDPLSCFSEPEMAQFEALLMKLHRHIKGNVG
jgi:hypothetical protein